MAKPFFLCDQVADQSLLLYPGTALCLPAAVIGAVGCVGLCVGVPEI